MAKTPAGSPVNLSMFMVFFSHAIVPRLRHDTCFQILSNGSLKSHLTFDVGLYINYQLDALTIIYS